MKKLIICMSMILTAALSASVSLCAQGTHLQSIDSVLPRTNIALHEIPLIGKFTSVDVGTYIDDIVAKVEAVNTPTILYYHTDRQFNVRGLTDSTGNIKELYAYSVYGQQTIMGSGGVVKPNTIRYNNYGFTGRYHDEETGLWYFRARYFSDELGRFISRDPLGYIDGMGLYGGYFAEGFGMDPSGKMTDKQRLEYYIYLACAGKCPGKKSNCPNRPSGYCFVVNSTKQYKCFGTCAHWHNSKCDHKKYSYQCKRSGYLYHECSS